MAAVTTATMTNARKSKSKTLSPLVAAGQNDFYHSASTSTNGVIANDIRGTTRIMNKKGKIKLNPSDWCYMCEGGEHAIFSYNPSVSIAPITAVSERTSFSQVVKSSLLPSPTISSNSLSNHGSGSNANGNTSHWNPIVTRTRPEEDNHIGQILRIRKQDILMQLSNSNSSNDNNNNNTNGVVPRATTITTNTKHRNHHMNVVKSSLSDYFDTPQTFQLDIDFVQKLYDQTVQSGKIPSTRLKDWNLLPSSSQLPSSTNQGNSSLRWKRICGGGNRGNTHSFSEKKSTCTNSSSTTHPSSFNNDGNNTNMTINATLHPNYSRVSSNTATIVPRYNNNFISQPSSHLRSTISISTSIPTHNHPSLSSSSSSMLSSSLSIEIKPKAGYLASSPLVHPLHRAKYYRTRFQLLQNLHLEGLITKGWKKMRLQTKSQYDPADFFSGKGKRIKKALGELFLSPQNNLKVIYQNHVLYGMEHKNESSSTTSAMATDDDDVVYNGNSEEKSGDGEFHKKALDDFFQISSSSSSPKTEDNHIDYNTDDHKDMKTKEQPQIQPYSTTQRRLASELQDITALILEKDEFLTTLGSLQESLDNLDTDGAVLVYKRLLQLCGGSQEHAEFLIDSLSPSIDSSSSSSHIQPTKQQDLQNEELAIELQKWDTFLWGHQFNQSDGADAHNRNYERGAKLVNEFSLMACVYLLQEWLTSLALCDLSFFVNITRVVMTDSSVVNNNGIMGDNAIEWKGVYGWKPKNRRRGKKNAAGTVFCKNGGVWNYSIKVVDCDGKPANKLRKREQKERVMRFFKKMT